MTEISSAHQLVRPRPLGLLHMKDNGQFDKPKSKVTDITDNKRERGHSGKGLNTRNNQKVMTDMPQQATLINIVAAVNDTFRDANDSSYKENIVPGSPTDALSNSMAIVSSIMTPRERSISIPTTQVVFELPIETIQKKPVYYKHSEDEEVYRKDSNNANVFSKHSVERTKVNSAKPFIVSEKVIKRLQIKEPCFDRNFEKQRQKSDSEPIAKQTVNKSWSPVRRLGAWKRPQSRTVHTLSKCDAVDIMDSDSIRRTQNDIGLNPDPTKVSAEEKLKIIPPTPSNPYPFYRAKSLPAVFPVKTKTPNATASQILDSQKLERYKNRPRSRGYFSQSSDARKAIHLSGSAGLEHSFSSNNLHHEHETVSPYKLDLEKSKTAQKSQYLLTGSDINPAEVRGKAFGHGSSKHGQYSSQNSLDLSQSKEDINQDTRKSRNGRPRSTNSSASGRSHSSNSMLPNNMKGCLSNRSGPGEFMAGRRTPKRVKFARRPSSTSVTSNTMVNDEPIAKINAFGGSSVVQIPKSNATAYSPGPEPLSAQELLRLKQKFIPANVNIKLSNKSAYHFSNHNGMRIKGITQKDIESKTGDHNNNDSEHFDPDKQDSDKENSDKFDSNVSERELDFSVCKDRDKSDDRSDTLTEVRADSEDKLRRLVSDLEDEESNDSDSTDEFSQLAAKHENSYKLVKAVDLDSYAEFEHKKMRKVLNSSFNANRNENSTGHFVRVKMRDGE